MEEEKAGLGGSPDRAILDFRYLSMFKEVSDRQHG